MPASVPRLPPSARQPCPVGSTVRPEVHSDHGPFLWSSEAAPGGRCQLTPSRLAPIRLSGPVSPGTLLASEMGRWGPRGVLSESHPVHTLQPHCCRLSLGLPRSLPHQPLGGGLLRSFCSILRAPAPPLAPNSSSCPLQGLLPGCSPQRPCPSGHHGARQHGAWAPVLGRDRR